MSSGRFDLGIFSNGLAALSYTAFAVHLIRRGYVRDARRGAAWALVWAVACCAMWSASSLAHQLAGNSWLGSLAMFADIGRYAGWYVFVWRLFRQPSVRRRPGRPGWMVVVGGATLVFALLAQTLGFARIDIPTGTLRLIAFAWTAMSLVGLMLIEQLFRNMAEDSRWNAKPLCLGLASTFLYDAYLFSQAALFNHIDADALSVRGAVYALALPLLLLSVARRQDWIAQLRVSRTAAFHSATLLIAGAYLLLISAAGYYVRLFGGQWGGALQRILVFAALAALMVLAVSGAVRAKLRVFVGKHFFRYRYDYRDEWLKFTHTLASQHSPEEMGLQVIRGLADMLESPAGGLWTKGSAQRGFTQAARWNVAEQLGTEDVAAPLCKFLLETGWVIDLDELHAFPARYRDLVLPPWLVAMPRAWLIVPLKIADDLTGFVVLTRPRTPMDVNWEVNDLLKTAGSQAASFLAQMLATEALLEARKFDAFNRMSAFVVHDLKNIVTQLSLMMKNAKRLHTNPEFQQDMLMTVENSLDRMRQMMLQLREGATPPGTAFGVDLVAVTERIASAASGKGRAFGVEILDKVVARGDAERLERILGHVVQNALDATEPAGAVWLKLDKSAGQARVRVGDDGHGMSQDFVTHRLFKPFQSTKPSGMGIGAYESFQYVQELGGQILVDSEPGKGTLVTLLLPLFHAENASDLHLRKAS